MSVTPEAVTEAFSTLADARRRYILYYLAEQETPVAFERLVTRVATWRTDRPPDAVDDTTLGAVRTALHHRHLPKLADQGFITYQDDPGVVALTDEIDTLEPFLGPARRMDLGADVPTERR